MTPATADQAPVSQVDRYVDVKGAAAFLSLSTHYLNRLRVEGGGPPYSTFGRAVRYRIGDLQEWAAAKRTRSTSHREVA